MRRCSKVAVEIAKAPDLLGALLVPWLRRMVAVLKSQDIVTTGGAA